MILFVEKPLTIRFGGGSSNPVIVHGLVSRHCNATIFTGQQLIADPVYGMTCPDPISGGINAWEFTANARVLKL